MIDKKYSGCDIAFNSPEKIFFPCAKFSQDVTFFCVGMGSSVHFDNKKIDILFLGESSTQRLDSTTLTAKINIQLTELLVQEDFV